MQHHVVYNLALDHVVFQTAWFKKSSETNTTAVITLITCPTFSGIKKIIAADLQPAA
jgi:hypothetical protein